MNIVQLSHLESLTLMNYLYLIHNPYSNFVNCLDAFYTNFFSSKEDPIQGPRIAFSVTSPCLQSGAVPQPIFVLVTLTFFCRIQTNYFIEYSLLWVCLMFSND